jgi:hypothetical protein
VGDGRLELQIVKMHNSSLLRGPSITHDVSLETPKRLVSRCAAGEVRGGSKYPQAMNETKGHSLTLRRNNEDRDGRFFLSFQS